MGLSLVMSRPGVRVPSPAPPSPTHECAVRRQECAHMWKRSLPVVLILVVAGDTIVSGCDRDDGDRDAAPESTRFDPLTPDPSDPCVIVKRRDVAEIFRHPVGPAERDIDGCSWTVGDFSVDLLVLTPTGSAEQVLASADARPRVRRVTFPASAMRRTTTARPSCAVECSTSVMNSMSSSSVSHPSTSVRAVSPCGRTRG